MSWPLGNRPVIRRTSRLLPLEENRSDSGTAGLRPTVHALETYLLKGDRRLAAQAVTRNLRASRQPYIRSSWGSPGRPRSQTA
jgi:hypothetical protein